MVSPMGGLVRVVLSGMGVAALGVAALGCGGKVVFDDERSDDPPPPVTDPGRGPSPGDGGSTGCADPPCNRDRCPPTLPTDGDECDVYQLDCLYPITCGDASALCDGFVWHVSLPICPQPNTCLDVPTEQECNQTGGCEWLVPGCGEPALPAAGCQSTSECTEEDCPFDWSCELVIVHPCTIDPCGMCYAERLACVPPIDG